MRDYLVQLLKFFEAESCGIEFSQFSFQLDLRSETINTSVSAKSCKISLLESEKVFESSFLEIEVIRGKSK